MGSRPSIPVTPPISSIPVETKTPLIPVETKTQKRVFESITKGFEYLLTLNFFIPVDIVQIIVDSFPFLVPDICYVYVLECEGENCYMNFVRERTCSRCMS